MSDLALILSTVAAPLGAGLIGFLATLFRRFTRAEAATVELQIGSDSVQISGATSQDQQRMLESFLDRFAASYNGDGMSPEQREKLAEEVSGFAKARPPIDEHTRLVLKYYARGVGQAQVSFYFSLAFASVGFMVIIAGVVLALIQPNSTIQTAVTMGAGVITDAIGALFFTLASRSRATMTNFIDKLRLDREREREFLKSIELIEIIGSDALRDSLKSIAALRFLRAESHVGSLPGFPNTAHLSVTDNEARENDSQSAESSKAPAAT